MKNSNIIITFIIALAIILPSGLIAQCGGDNIFLGCEDSDWDNLANWSSDCVPTATITGHIQIKADCVIPGTNNTNYDFQSTSTLNIVTGVSLTNSGTGAWTMNGEMTGEGSYVSNLTLNGDIEPGSTDGPSVIGTAGADLLYGGQTYATIKIDCQLWMAENLAYLPSVVGPGTGSETDPYYYVYGYDGTDVAAAKANSNYTTYGVLYNWPAANAAETCPTGWHLPSDAEWTALTNYVGNQSGYWCNNNSNYIAKSLAATTNWNTSSNSCAVGNDLSANNATGFSVLPGGYRFTGGSFSYQGSGARLWSSTVLGSAAWFRSLSYTDADVNRSLYDKAFGYSVRCVRD